MCTVLQKDKRMWSGGFSFCSVNDCMTVSTAFNEREKYNSIVNLTNNDTLCCRYGWVFLYETYLYHVVRTDIRHNFSPYFYMLYLTAGDETSFVIKFLTFFPQVLLLVAIAMRFHEDLPLSCFLCTFTFVMLNKVCTSQVCRFCSLWFY